MLTTPQDHHKRQELRAHHREYIIGVHAKLHIISPAHVTTFQKVAISEQIQLAFIATSTLCFLVFFLSCVRFEVALLQPCSSETDIMMLKFNVCWVTLAFVVFHVYVFKYHTHSEQKMFQIKIQLTSHYGRIDLQSQKAFDIHGCSNTVALCLIWLISVNASNASVCITWNKHNFLVQRNCVFCFILHTCDAMLRKKRSVSTDNFFSDRKKKEPIVYQDKQLQWRLGHLFRHRHLEYRYPSRTDVM